MPHFSFGRASESKSLDIDVCLVPEPAYVNIDDNDISQIMVYMENWDDLRVLLAVAESETMSDAAQALGVNVATVSRRLDRLSATLGTQAYVKTPEGWAPSAQSKKLIEIASAFDNELKAARNARISDSALADVNIAIRCPPYVASSILTPRLGLLLSEGAHISLNITERVEAEGLGDSDIILTLQRPSRGRLATRRIGQIGIGLFRHRQGSADGAWVALNDFSDYYPGYKLAQKYFGHAPSLRVQTWRRALTAMLAARMAGILPRSLIRGRPELVEISLPNPMPSQDIWLSYHITRKGDSAILTVRDWIESCFQHDYAAEDADA